MSKPELPTIRALYGLTREALPTLLFTAAMVVAAWAWGANKLTIISAIGLFSAGLAGLFIILWRQEQSARLIDRLCGDKQNLRLSLQKNLSKLAGRLDALSGRTDNVHPVTRLPTRETLQLAMTKDIAAGRGADCLMGAIRFADFDRLAAFDQSEANAILCRFALRLVTAVRPKRVIAQVDRDCVCVWFSGETNLDIAAAEFRALVYVAGQEIEGASKVVTPLIEIAAVSYPRDGEDAASLLLRVTAALSRPGASVTGELVLQELPSRELAREQFMLEQDLAQAIAADQLRLVFQPVVDLAVGRMVGAEALLRWDHPELGPVSPARFMPIVETIGLSERYGMWVLNQACREARAWLDAGFSDLRVAVNLSAHQSQDPDLEQKIARTLQRHGLPPNALELELTETAAMADVAHTARLFSTLRAMGISLALDDFGSGYSSLSYLKNLPFDKLKIDREFVIDLDVKRDSRAICGALIELGRGLDLTVLAEGVESQREVDALRTLGCNVFQGHYFSKPLLPEDFRKLVQDTTWRSGLKKRFPSAPLFQPESRFSA